jgi:hypothetical protein
MMYATKRRTAATLAYNGIEVAKRVTLFFTPLEDSMGWSLHFPEPMMSWN